MGNGLGHRVSLAAARNAEEALVLVPPVHALDNFLNRLRLIAAGFVIGYDIEGRHRKNPPRSLAQFRLAKEVPRTRIIYVVEIVNAKENGLAPVAMGAAFRRLWL